MDKTIISLVPNKSDEQLKAELLLGLDIDICNITLKNHKLGTIIKDIKLDKYNYLSTLSIIEIKDILKDKFENIKDVTVYKLSFVIPDINKWYIEFLNTFTNYNNWESNDLFGIYMVQGERITLNEDDLDLIFKVFKKMYWIERGNKKDTIDPSMAVSEEVRQMAEEFAELEREKNKKKKHITLNGIIAGVCSTSHNYSFFNVENLTMYQLMTEFYVNDAHEHYNYIMSSAYVGMYDLSKTKVEDLHYCNEIDV